MSIKAVGVIIAVAAAFYGARNIMNGSYRRAKNQGRIAGLILAAIFIIIGLLSK